MIKIPDKVRLKLLKDIIIRLDKFSWNWKEWLPNLKIQQRNVKTKATETKFMFWKMKHKSKIPKMVITGEENRRKKETMEMQWSTK